ncbi:uncharacterized protein LOC116289065 [Actinia tenebrosa]|uniref:Uncharacterized protein LOC116289065 n=1 Tax=Actinia tenebrosa TaxID=6105 RepID=A0A6P8HGU7_ACTTE|nr:uncharacterized protein LOC116289065 [Actinia tenebrosa]XP_031551817.1 uncharacterized protein LOC116289065 [Actinia tenebrosa]
MVHHPEEVWMRYGYSREEPWKNVKGWNGDQLENLRRLYDGPIRVKDAKVKDLKKLAEKHLPPEKRGFYMNLNNGAVEEDGLDNFMIAKFTEFAGLQHLVDNQVSLLEEERKAPLTKKELKQMMNSRTKLLIPK